MKKIIIIVVAAVVVLAAVGGGAAYFLLKRSHKPAAGGEGTEATASEEAAAEEPSGEESAPPVFVKIDRFVVNVDGDPEKKGVMSIEIQAELANAKLQERVEAFKPKIQSDLIMLLGSQKFGELSTPEGKQKLLALVRDKVNAVIGAKPATGVKSVAFTSLILEER